MTSTTTPLTPPNAGDGGTSADCLTAPCQARIIDAYFARKVVTEADGRTSVRLNRIERHVLGRVLYVVVEGQYLAAGESVTITLKTVGTGLTGVDRQALRVTNGTADVESFTARVGDTSAFNDNTGACAYTNLVQFGSKAVFKIALRPHARTNFDAWAQRIQAAGQAGAQIGIEVTCASVPTASSELRGTPFRLENKKVYEIHHADNRYNFLSTPAGSTARSKIGHIENSSTDLVKYYYFNRIDNWHEITEVTQTRVRRRANGRRLHNTSAQANIPRGYVDSAAAPAGGDASMNYYYNQDPRDRTTRDPRTNYFRIVSADNPNGGGRDYGVIQYDLADPNNANDMVDLIRMPDSLGYSQETGANRVRVAFTFRGTARKFCNPRCFAGFIGVLAQLGRDDVVCTGMCFGDATSYPSVSHPNGDSVDTAYLAALADEQAKVNAFGAYYYRAILRGNTGWKGRLTGSRFHANHEDHLHSGEFNLSMVVVLNPAA
jgi:hypothetical protein